MKQALQLRYASTDSMDRPARGRQGGLFHVLRPDSFYESGAPARAETGRLLLFAYHFPPDSAAGALRWQKLALYAAERGWGLDVLTRDPAELAASDPSRLRELPPNVRVYGVPQPEIAAQWLERQASRAYRALFPKRPESGAAGGAPGASHRTSFAREELRVEPLSPRFWIRSYHGWQLYASQRAWGRRAARLARLLYDPTRHRLAVSCGPPHGVHEGARRLSRATGIPFVMDMRDPWSQLERWVESVASPTTPRIARSHERTALAQASLVVTNTECARAAMQALYPSEADRIISVMNGYDEDDPLPTATRDGCFRLAYAGSIYLDRNPRTLFVAVARLVEEFQPRPEQLSVEFMGPPADLGGETIEDLARQCGIARFVKVHPPGTRRQAAEFLARASVLVNLPQDSHSAIPSKVFEYLRIPAWLLALEEAGSATETVLRNTGADVAHPRDVDRIAEILRTRYLQHRGGESPRALAADGRFSRRAQAQRLFQAIDEVVAGSRQGPLDRSSDAGCSGPM